MDAKEYHNLMGSIKKRYNEEFESIDKQFISENALYSVGDVVNFKMTSDIKEVGKITSVNIFPFPNSVEILYTLDINEKQSLMKGWSNIKAFQESIISKVKDE